jgi:hypothetical protein
MPKTGRSPLKRRSRQSIDASIVRIAYPDMTVWRTLRDDGYEDEEIDDMNPFNITFPESGGAASDVLDSVRRSVGTKIGSRNLYTRHGRRYALNSDDFHPADRDAIELILHRHGFKVARDNDGDRWTRPHLVETSRILAF